MPGHRPEYRARFISCRGPPVSVVTWAAGMGLLRLPNLMAARRVGLDRQRQVRAIGASTSSGSRWRVISNAGSPSCTVMAAMWVVMLSLSDAERAAPHQLGLGIPQPASRCGSGTHCSTTVLMLPPLCQKFTAFGRAPRRSMAFHVHRRGSRHSLPRPARSLSVSWCAVEGWPLDCFLTGTTKNFTWHR